MTVMMMTGQFVPTMIDLHIHSTYSDGTCTPAELVSIACSLGLNGLALTDHDTLEGTDEFLAAAREHKLDALAGVEISARYTNPETGLPGDGELHILGYFPDWDAGRHGTDDALLEIRRNRNERNPKIIDRLQTLGCDITIEEVNDHAANSVVGRPHIAAILVRKGYASSFEQAFSRFLATDAAAYVPKKIFSPAKAIQTIRNAGGLAVLAHPKMLHISSEQHMRTLLDELISFGLEGIEVFCSTHQPHDVCRFRDIAERCNLVLTGGTDFHGENKPDIRLGTGFGNVQVPDGCMDAIRSRVKERSSTS